MMGGGRGGPGTSTMVVELYIFNALIKTSLPGIASAVSVLLFLVSLLLIVPLFAVRRRANEEETADGHAMQAGSTSHEAGPGAEAWHPAPGDLSRAGAVHLHDPDVAEEPGGIHLQQGRASRSALVLDHFENVLFESPFFAWMGNSIILAGGAVVAEHRGLLPRRLCDRADAVQGPRHCCSRSARR